VTAKIRYRAPEANAVLYPEGRQVLLRFEEPQQAITPGQAVVFYSNDIVLGGGTIQSANDFRPGIAVH
jgi:tRNA-specific 2-thiouridylase